MELQVKSVERAREKLRSTRRPPLSGTVISSIRSYFVRSPCRSRKVDEDARDCKWTAFWCFHMACVGTNFLASGKKAGKRSRAFRAGTSCDSGSLRDAALSATML